MGAPSASATTADHGGTADRLLPLADGRTLGWAEYGDPGGRPLVFFHGTPSCRLDAFTLHDAASTRGVRLIAPDRPGMGLSSWQPDRRLLDHNADVEALADHLGLERFSVLGYSGGGPYGLAAAARLAERLDQIVIVSGCSPPDRPDSLSDTGIIDRVLTVFAQRLPSVAGGVLRSMELGARLFPSIGLKAWEADLSASDRAAFKEMVRQASVNPLDAFFESLRSGPVGAVVDYRLSADPWDFLPEEISHPVQFWHGDADRIVPLHHAHDLVARIPRARLEVVPGAGHLLVRSAAGSILDRLVAREAL
jgi:pimeloyl-ACP methyl ester carboxylesterase